MQATMFDTILLSNVETIRKIGVRYLVRSWDLDDFVQEVVYRAYRSREQLRDISLLPNWLGRIAKNTAFDWNERKTPELMDVLPDIPDERTSPFDGGSEYAYILEQVMETLDPIDRDLLYSYYVAETSYRDLQERYRLSYSSVTSRLHRAKKQASARIQRILASRPHAIPRSGSTADIANGSIFLVGGYTERVIKHIARNSIPTVEEFDFPTQSWIRRMDMPTSRKGLASCVLNGKIYAVGGAYFDGTDVTTQTLEVYDPQTDSWSKKSPMPTSRMGLAVATMDGKAYAMGGATAFAPAYSWWTPTDVVEMYDPATDRWTRKREMPTPRGAVTACTVNGKIYAMSGFDARQEPLETVEEYDPRSDRWTRKRDMPCPRIAVSIAVSGGKIYVFGGHTTGNLAHDRVDEYDPETDSWRPMPPMSVGRGQHVNCMTENGVLIVGGRNSPIAMSHVVEYRHIAPSIRARRNAPRRERSIGLS